MLYEFEEQCIFSRPKTEGTHERGQQHVINECVINRRHVLQKSVRLINRKRDGEHARGAFCVCALSIDGETARMLRRSGPITQLPLQLRRQGQLVQPFGPTLKGGRLRWQLDTLVRLQFPVNVFPIFQQYSPRNAVNNEMVNHKQETLPARTQIEQHDTHEWPVAKIESSLRLFGSRFHR